VSGRRSIEGDQSAAFAGVVGVATPASGVAKQDYLIDTSRFPSEGNWAFCRFASEEVPAVRLGFQRGGFNGGPAHRVPSPRFLQLHLEVMTREGAILWLPSGVYPADAVHSDLETMNVELAHRDQLIFSFRGWPSIECHFRSDDGYLEADLQFELNTVTVLPDCRLPHCLFAMWESMGIASGTVRYGDRAVPVSGMLFFDHTRVLATRHAVRPRQAYIYTTLYLEDGSGLFGYHSVDSQGLPIEDYCFGVYLDAAGHGRFLNDTALIHLALDADEVAKGWHICWRAPDFFLAADVEVQCSPILKCWGSPSAPQSRRDYSIIPLVLNASVHINDAGFSRALRGYGLAEYFNANLWPADKAAMEQGPT
jgi:hypothetical protein